MNFSAFVDTISGTTPPLGLPVSLVSLWYDAKNDWASAHDLINDLDDKDAAWVHAYLHRKEGDTGNAGYWYRRAGKEICHTPLQEEWASIAKALLEK